MVNLNFWLSITRSGIFNNIASFFVCLITFNLCIDVLESWCVLIMHTDCWWACLIRVAWWPHWRLDECSPTVKHIMTDNTQNYIFRQLQTTIFCWDASNLQFSFTENSHRRFLEILIFYHVIFKIVSYSRTNGLIMAPNPVWSTSVYSLESIAWASDTQQVYGDIIKLNKKKSESINIKVKREKFNINLSGRKILNKIVCKTNWKNTKIIYVSLFI